MPSRLQAPVLTLDAAKMQEVDPRNIESLFGMWTVFNKCSQNIKDGSRLENLSWRLWARETLCCPPQPEKTIVPAIDVPAGRTSQVPSLSNSYESEDDSSSDRENETTPRSRRHTPPQDADDSALSKSRGKEVHLSPTTLKKIVVHIQEKSELGPLSPTIEASIPPIPETIAVPKDAEIDSKEMQNSTESCMSGTTAVTGSTSTTQRSDHRTSESSVSSADLIPADGLIRTGSVVHGFSPVSTSFKGKSTTALPVPSSRLAVSPAKKTGMFQLGASSEDDDSSFEHRPSALKPPPARSSLSHSLTRRQISNGSSKKQTSFREILEQHKRDSDADDQADEGAIASDSDDSVFEEDEEEDWEDTPSEDEKLVANALTTFRRVESRPDLVSRPSMLSMQIEQRRRASSGLQNEISHSQPALRRSRVSTPNGPSMPGSPSDHDDEGGLMMRGAPTQARPIVITQPSSQSMAHSPRTTRRNMLSTELTESLRKHLLWERQQKSQAVNAFVRRNRNAQSMANLQTAALQPPQPDRSNNSWNQEFENPWEFNNRGW
ncbi:uncharacterized protein AB675_11459 [Cyphellophora attinorum]|uniref:Uncharacterized protein n=1 Tax=Cyphellophora attinorum TaxID=1664694 RepID=A0A0N1H9F8_9EURO|nr:uncharacterized protein AB675_11459 [Phialophora attinorum]KPI40220.1 hypothetical protein AB675_11459 [Phialophora attinorum]